MEEVRPITVIDHIQPGEVIHIQRKHNEKPPFGCFGKKSLFKSKESTMHDKDSHMNIYDIGESMSGSTWVVLRLLAQAVVIKDRKDYTVEPKIRFARSLLNTADRRRWDIGIKQAIDLDIVRIFKRGSYMINPYFDIPNNFEEHRDIWNSLDR